MSGFSDKLLLAVKNADSKTALKIADVASEYGEIVVDAVNKCDCDSIYKITHYIAESGVSNKVASELFEALSKHGDTLIKAVEKCGPKNIENIVEILSKINPNQVDAVIDLLVHHGDDLVKAICKCGDEYTDLIIRCVSHEKFAGDVATHFLKAMSDHSDTMIKAIGRCGADNFDTIADYSKIFGKFADKAERIVNSCMVKKFVGLDEALSANGADAICFATSKFSDEVCAVSVNRIYIENPTINVPSGFFDDITNFSGDIGKYYSNKYNSLFSKEYLSHCELDDNIVNEYEKLIDAIENARNHFKTHGFRATDVTGIPNDYSAFTDRSVINCAEIWAAREAILNGCKFDDLVIPTFHLKSSEKFALGDTFTCCKNCQQTFEKILTQN